MKNLKILLIAFVTISILFACKKKDNTPAPTVVGFWKGKYGNGTNVPENIYAFLFRNNGTVRIYADFGADTTTGSKAEGTYTVTGTTVNTNYKYLAGSMKEFSTTATLNGAYTTMTGTWGIGTATSGGGKFDLTKQ